MEGDIVECSDVVSWLKIVLASRQCRSMFLLLWCEASADPKQIKQHSTSVNLAPITQGQDAQLVLLEEHKAHKERSRPSSTNCTEHRFVQQERSNGGRASLRGVEKRRLKLSDFATQELCCPIPIAVDTLVAVAQMLAEPSGRVEMVTNNRPKPMSSSD